MRKNTQIMQCADGQNITKKSTTYIFVFKQLATILLALAIGNTWGQEKASTDSIFEEGFENGLDKWSQVYVKTSNNSPTREWSTRAGGAKPQGAPTNKPETAQEGVLNAYFYISSVERTYQTYLISPTIDFSGAKKPLLIFWYSLYESQMGDPETPEEINTDNFEFTLCYRNSPTSEWTEYRNYKEATNDVTPWRCDSLYLPEELCGNTQVQIAFLGKTHSIGLGICIDNIKIKETLVINKYVESIYALQPNTNMIPTSSTDNPILMLRVPVLGNNGTLLLNSIAATALKQASQSIPASGMKLFYTQTEEFRTDNLLSTTSISNGKATFSNINFDLPLGNAYLWIACNVKDEDGEHRLKNNVIDFKIEAESINIGGNMYPSDSLSPVGERTVNESIFFDNFENENDSWTFEGEFERAQPQGLGGTNGGNSDPGYARSGDFIIGTDITGIGSGAASPGNYEKNIGNRAYSATTTLFNGYYYRDINILLYRWLNCNTGDSAFVSYSLDGGNKWTDAWRTTAIMQESSWTYQKLNISRFADRSNSINLQLSLGPTPSQLQWSGWNIDDFALVGTFVYADAAIDSIIAPNSGCGLDNEPITIKIRNAGYNAITIPFTVSYSIIYGDSVTTVTETISDGMARDEVREYTFDALADLSALGEYTIRAKVTLDEDEDSRNNSQQKDFLSLPYIELPYAEDFNSTSNHGGYWYSYGSNSTWQHGTTTDGKSCWITKTNDISNSYLANDSAWIESPCINFSNVQKPILEFMLKGDAASTDGTTVYYSKDNGASWTHIPDYATSYPHESWRWHNSAAAIAALGKKGWTGSFDWTCYKQLLPDELAGESSVKLRFVFASAEGDGAEHKGFAIDDIRIYEAPADAGIAEIVNPTTDCYLSKEETVTVKIRNYGIRGITSADSLFATVNINNKLTLTDTFLVAPADTIAIGDEREFNFSQKVNLWNKKDYAMTAYTTIKGDTLLFSSTNNDTTKATASVLGEPTYTLGPDIGTLHPDLINIFGGKSLPDSTWFASYLWTPWKDADGIMIAENTDLYPTTPPTSTQRWIGVLDSDKLPVFPDGKEKGYYYEYTIVVTNAAGCQAYDTIRIIKSETNIGIDKIAFKFDADDDDETPQEFMRAVNNKIGFGSTQYCISKQPEEVTVTIKNEAGVEVSEGETISLCYSYLDDDNNLVTYAEDTIMKADLPAGESFEYTFKQAPQLELDGVQNLIFFARINADMNHNNDSASIAVTAWPLPTADITIGGKAYDSIPLNNPAHTLLTTAAITNATYLWNDGVTTSLSFEVTETNTAYYGVTVADEHSCGIATDSILIIADSWKIDGIVAPTDQCEPIDNAELTISVSNLSGVNSYEAGYTIPAIITVNGEKFREEIVLSSDVDENGSFDYTFNSPIDMSRAGLYSISVQLVPMHDINRNDNDFANNVNIWGVKQVDIGDYLVYTLEADTIVLDAGAGFMSYLWSTEGFTPETSGLTDSVQTFAIPSKRMETYKIYVEDFHECPSSEAEVTIMPFDLSITEITSPKTSCNLNNATTAELKIRNNGQEIIEEGTIIYLYVQTDNGAVSEHEQELSEMGIGQSQQISFSYVPTFTESASEHIVKMWLSWEIDKFNYNDTLLQTIYQYSSPEAFDLGNDIYTNRPDTIQLVAPAGYHDYIWSNDSTGSNTLDVTYTGSAKYWVRITNGYGCSASDSISIFTTDLTMSVLSGAVNSCSPVDADSVTAQIEVNRYNFVPAGTQFTVSYECNGYTSSKDIKIEREITFSNPYTFTFDTPLTLSDTGNYTLKTNFTAYNTTDVDITNNATTSTVRIGALPLPFADTVRTYDNLYTIDAGDGFKTFNWLGNPNAEQRYVVVSSDTYTLTAIDTNGCSTTDSTHILFVVPSYDICALGFASTMCEPSEPTTLSFYLKNTGNDVVAANTTIPVSYKIAENEATNEQYTFSKNLNANDSVLITFATQSDLRNGSGFYSLQLKAIVDSSYTATTIKTITIMPNPEPNLGDDVKTNKDTWQLTAGGNTGSLQWSTGETGYYINVAQTGDYWVTATNNYGCSASDTVNVFFIQPDVSVVALNSPLSACGSINNESISIDIINDGEKNISAGQSLGLRCTIGTDTLTEEYVLPLDFAVGATLTHTLSQQLSLDSVGQYTLVFYTSINNTPNDTATFSIDVHSLPKFSFDIDSLIVSNYPVVINAPLFASGYLWSTGDSTANVSITADATVSLTITDANGCQFADTIIVALKKSDIINPPVIPNPHTGIDEQEMASILIYPNPVSDVLNINFGDNTPSDYRVSIINAAGQTIFAEQPATDLLHINMTNWKQGIYIVKIANRVDAVSVRILKQ